MATIDVQTPTRSTAGVNPWMVWTGGLAALLGLVAAVMSANVTDGTWLIPAIAAGVLGTVWLLAGAVCWQVRNR